MLENSSNSTTSWNESESKYVSAEQRAEQTEVQEPSCSGCLFAGYPPWMFYVAAACCALFMIVGIPGNLITVAALFRTKKLRNATAVFIMNLSMSDLMFCCFNLPLATSTFLQGAWVHGPLLCRLFPLLRYGLVAVSLFTVLAITINRYVMIGHPRLYPKLYKRKYLALMVLATWLGGFGALVPTWFERWGRFGLDPAIGSCSILPDINGRSPKEFLFVLAFVAPCIAIVVCYARIFFIVRAAREIRCRRDESRSRKGRCTTKDSAIGSFTHTTTTTTTTTTSDTNLGSSSSPVQRELSVSKFPQTDECCFTHLTVPGPTTPSKMQQFLPGSFSLLRPPSFSGGSQLTLQDEADSEDCNSRRLSGRGGNNTGEINYNSTGRMTDKDRKLLKMILVIFSSFIVCYLPITVSKTFKGTLDWRGLNIAGYILIYLTTCINPIIYVVMSSEYRQAYKNVLLCRSESTNSAQQPT